MGATLRYWAFAVFVALYAMAAPGGLKRAFYTERPLLQTMRGLLLVVEVVLVVFAFSRAGLATSQAVCQVTPLLITILSVPLLGETVGWRRGMAVTVGLIGVLIIINPVGVTFSIDMLLPLGASLAYAFYGISTRAVSTSDSAMTSLVYTGAVGAIAITLLAPFFWTTIQMADVPALAALCATGVIGNYTLIKAYELLEAAGYNHSPICSWFSACLSPPLCLERS